jgi:hypothetical protein
MQSAFIDAFVHEDRQSCDTDRALASEG